MEPMAAVRSNRREGGGGYVATASRVRTVVAKITTASRIGLFVFVWALFVIGGINSNEN
jgi:hypothetical protein